MHGNEFKRCILSGEAVLFISIVLAYLREVNQRLLLIFTLLSFINGSCLHINVFFNKSYQLLPRLANSLQPLLLIVHHLVYKTSCTNFSFTKQWTE